LYILSQKDLAAELMDKFKWGHTFLELNANLLEDYAQAEKQQEIPEIVVQYFPNLS
jgi:pre-rRNA-processing protein TSR3